MAGAFIYIAVAFVTAVVEPWDEMLASNPDRYYKTWKWDR